MKVRWEELEDFVTVRRTLIGIQTDLYGMMFN